MSCAVYLRELIIFAFAFNAKSFAIAIIVFFLFSFSSNFLERLQKVFLATFHDSITRKRVTKIGPISLDTSIKKKFA